MKWLCKITLWTIVPGLFLLYSCKSGSTMIKCPELSAKKPHPAFLWAQNHKHISRSKPANAQVQATIPQPNIQPPMLASSDKGISFKLPSLLSRKLTDSDEIAMNQMLGSYSANRISLQKKENGKLYVSAASAKDLFAFSKNVSTQLHPRGYYERRYADNGGVALAGGILGMIGFVFSFIPILSILAIPMGLVAIILGAVGLNSGRRRMAVLGITFGVLAMLIGALFTFLYFVLWATL